MLLLVLLVAVASGLSASPQYQRIEVPRGVDITALPSNRTVTIGAFSVRLSDEYQWFEDRDNADAAGGRRWWYCRLPLPRAAEGDSGAALTSNSQALHRTAARVATFFANGGSCFRGDGDAAFADAGQGHEYQLCPHERFEVVAAGGVALPEPLHLGTVPPDGDVRPVWDSTEEAWVLALDDGAECADAGRRFRTRVVLQCGARARGSAAVVVWSVAPVHGDACRYNVEMQCEEVCEWHAQLEQLRTTPIPCVVV